MPIHVHFKSRRHVYDRNCGPNVCTLWQRENDFIDLTSLWFLVHIFHQFWQNSGH